MLNYDASITVLAESCPLLETVSLAGCILATTSVAALKAALPDVSALQRT
jgi:hypothetical protein